MGLPRSTFYDAPSIQADDTEIVARVRAICDEFEAYGYRRVGAALRHQGIVVNSKKVRRLMREHGLQPRRRRLISPRPTARSPYGRVAQTNISISLATSINPLTLSAVTSWRWTARLRTSTAL